MKGFSVWQAARSFLRQLAGALALALLISGAAAQTVFEARIVGHTSGHTVSWNSRDDYRYHIEMSTDLVNWMDSGIHVHGNGDEQDVTFQVRDGEARFFYRVWETGFLTLPLPSQAVDPIEGVRFAFNLDLFPTLAAKLRVYRRPWNSGAAWTQIGLITEFLTVGDLKLVRGSAVWVAAGEGEFEVKAEAVAANGSLMATEQRHVIVATSNPPSVEITGALPPNGSPPEIQFATAVSTPSGQVRKVEYFDNGILIGTDDEAPFGDNIYDLETAAYIVWGGTHSFTAKVYDSNGKSAETEEPFVVQSALENIRPVLITTSPASGTVIEQGQLLTLGYTASDANGFGDLVQIDAYNLASPLIWLQSTAPSTTGSISLDTTGWAVGPHIINCLAHDSLVHSYPSYTTIIVKAPGSTGNVFAESLAADLAEEATALPTNASFRGVPISSSLFSGGLAAGVQMDQGIILTSGRAEVWDGGDFSEGTGSVLNSPGDRDLQNRVSGITTYDAAVLEFDLFCTHGQLELEYQFGSEEYDEFIRTFNDAFMVTVDGVLVSLLPDGTDIISVHNVHGPVVPFSIPAVNGHLFLDDDGAIDAMVTDQARQVEYDGMTRRLRAHAFVTPNTSHHVKIVIADAVDKSLDAALFLKRGSLRTITPQP